MNALKSEFIKFTSLRSFWVNTILLIGSIAGIMVLLPLASGTRESLNWQSLVTTGFIFTIIAISMFGTGTAGEINSGMQAHAFITQDSRTGWLAARLFLTTVYTTLTYAVAVSIAFGLALLNPNVKFVNENAISLLNPLLTLIVFGVIAASIGVLTQSKVAALAIPIAWFLVIENLISYAALSYKALEWLPLVSPGIRIQNFVTQNLEHTSVSVVGFGPAEAQPDWFNFAVITCWVVVFLAAAFIVNSRRDAKQ